jgi:hypothetical protein
MTTFTATESLRRLRALTAALRARGDLPGGASIEVGTRTHPVHTDAPTYANYFHEDDDLEDFYPLRDYAKYVKPGEVVHLYISDRDGLIGTHTTWVGTADAEPALLDTNARWSYDPEDEDFLAVWGAHL